MNMDFAKIVSLRMERQHLARPANEEEYLALYRDMQPGMNVYWNGFGMPPVMSFRAAFDDIEFNRERQYRRELVKGRFAGGNLGWIVPEDMELFMAVYQKPVERLPERQQMIMDLIAQQGPSNIARMKEETGLLVKEITPALHRLQEAFLLYEDQYDGEWDRGWYLFSEMFPEVDGAGYTRQEALMILMERFARRMVWFDAEMAKSYFRVPIKDIRAALDEMLKKGKLSKADSGYVLTDDCELLETYVPRTYRSVFAVHRNDILYRAQEHLLKKKFLPMTEKLPYDHELLQFLLIDGEFKGAVVGHFRNGPYDLNDVVCGADVPAERKEEIIEAVRKVNFGKSPDRFMGKTI